MKHALGDGIVAGGNTAAHDVGRLISSIKSSATATDAAPRPAFDAATAPALA